MPIHAHPLLRAREEEMELAGVIQPLDSEGVRILKVQEAVGQRVKIVPVITISAHNQVYNPK